MAFSTSCRCSKNDEDNSCYICNDYVAPMMPRVIDLSIGFFGTKINPVNWTPRYKLCFTWFNIGHFCHLDFPRFDRQPQTQIDDYCTRVSLAGTERRNVHYLNHRSVPLPVQHSHSATVPKKPDFSPEDKDADSEETENKSIVNKDPEFIIIKIRRETTALYTERVERFDLNLNKKLNLKKDKEENVFKNVVKIFYLKRSQIFF